MLGKEFAKLYGKPEPAAKKDLGGLPLGSKPRPVATKLVVEEDVEEDLGRSALGKPKRKIEADALGAEREDGYGDDDEVPSRSKTGGKGSASSSKRGSTYLDEVLAEKLRKKKKKKKGEIASV